MADSRRWVMLGIGTAAQTAGTLYLYGLPFLLPALRRTTDLPLWELGLLVACPSLGMVLALIGWGVLADRRGERFVIGLGLTGGAAFLAGAASAAGPALFVLLALAGAAGSAVYAASGRVVTGWFAPGERGLAMGIRQTSQPLGVAAASAVLPVLADSGGPRLALLVAAAVSALTGIVAALLLVDGPRPTAGRTAAASPASGSPTTAEPAASPGSGAGATHARSPYRSPTLWRVHGASALLVVAQFVVGAYALDYLVTERGWPVRTAGPLIAGAQLVAAAARVLAGRWSDRSAQRLRPLRVIAAGTAAALGALAVAETLHAPPAAPLLLVALIATVSWHGVAYAAVADVAPASWAGRATSAQTVLQNVAATATPPLFGLAVAGLGFGPGFAVAALFPLAAVAVLHGLTVDGRPSTRPPDPGTAAGADGAGRPLSGSAGRRPGVRE